MRVKIVVELDVSVVIREQFPISEISPRWNLMQYAVDTVIMFSFRQVGFLVLPT